MGHINQKFIVVIRGIEVGIQVGVTLPLGWIHVKIWVKKTWDPNHPLVDVIIRLDIKPKLENRFLNLRGAPNFLNTLEQPNFGIITMPH